MDVERVKVALIGSGNISYTYMNTLTSEFSIVDFVGCSDLIPEKSKARAELFGVRQMTNEEILNDPSIEIVLNTTEIYNHSAVTKMILEAGKHVYSEKSFGCTYEEAKANVELARQKGLRAGSAPDIYLGSAYQTARKLIDDGYIGTPLTAHAMCFRGYNVNQAPGLPPAGSKHGDAGTTVTYDMGGYYVNALVALLGPVQRVSGYTRFFEERIYENPLHPKYKQPIDKRTGSTTLLGCLEFESGCYASLVLTQDGFGPEIPRVEIYGTKGTLTLPDPNCFGGWGNDVYLTRIGNDGRFKMPFTHAYSDTDPSIPTKSGKREPCHNSHRGIAVADMAWAIRRNRPHRSSAELALHTVEIISAIDKSTLDNKVYTMESRPQRPAPLAPGFFGNVAETSLDMI